jgi:rubrerythrin
MQGHQYSAFTTHAGSWFLPLRKNTAAKEEQAGIRCETALSCCSRKRLQRVQATFRHFMVLSPGYSSLRGCNHTRKQSAAGPDISLLRPELQQQWHHAKNQLLGDKQITASGSLRVWWSCDQCPCGLPHEWLATVSERQDMDSRCPFCTNNRLCQHNSLLTKAPAVAAYWDSAMNGLTPDQVMAHSSTRRHWLCPSCGHRWQAPIRIKVRDGSGCPRCSSRNKYVNRKPTLTQSQHPAMLEFDFERNQRSRQEATRWCIGSVLNAPKVNHTCLWQLQRTVLALVQVALIVQAKRLVFAIHCSPCTLR